MENTISIADFETNIFNLNFYIQGRNWFKPGFLYFESTFCIKPIQDPFNNSKIEYAYRTKLHVNVNSFASVTNFKIRSKKDFLKISKYLLEVVKGVTKKYYNEIVFVYKYSPNVYKSSYILNYDKTDYFDFGSTYFKYDSEDEFTQILKYQKIGKILGSLQQPAKNVISSLQSPYQNLINQLLNK